MSALLDKLNRRAPDADDALLADLLDSAGALICAYTGRAAVPEALVEAQLELALIFLNRMGMEGESAHAEGETSRTADDLPGHLKCQLDAHRLARTVSA